MVSERKLANAVGGKSARACDNCVRKRARWYCAADDAFLCQSCDASVHSANPLARRHERVGLKIASIDSEKDFQQHPLDDDESKSGLHISVPSWHQGFARKPRTPRRKKRGKLVNPLHLVPEMCSEEQSHEDDDEQLLYRVPIFDPFEVARNTLQKDAEDAHRFPTAASDGFGRETNHFEGILPSESDLAEFAADVESLLGKGLEHESFDMQGLGLLDCDENGRESNDCSLPGERNIKVEDEEIGQVAPATRDNHRVDLQLDLGRETFELNFDCGSPFTCEEEDEEENKAQKQECRLEDDSNKTFLKLDYEGVMSAWDDEKSPWTTGERPDLNSGNCCSDCLGTSGTMHVYGEMGMMSGHAAAMADRGREARVSRYREKRRTRLFSKKIRYEVRKLNAEKRPRMKGRFVKRSNFAAAAFPLLSK